MGFNNAFTLFLNLKSWFLNFGFMCPDNKDKWGAVLEAQVENRVAISEWQVNVDTILLIVVMIA